MDFGFMDEIMKKNMENIDISEMNEKQDVIDEFENVKEMSTQAYTGVEGFEDEVVFISGNPMEIAEELDYAQGDNSYEALGCCGLVSSANFLNICGIEASEESIVGFAVENDLCNYEFYLPPEHRGGTGDEQLEKILESHGIECSVYYPQEDRGSIEGIAEAIENGHAVTMGVNAGFLWDEANAVDNCQANHQITVTGSVRDENGEVVGLVVCDSGRGLETDACRVVTREEVEDFYVNVRAASVIISDNPVR